MTPCTTCLTVDCIDVGDLTRYNFQLNAFISPQYTFVVSCPVGVVCQPGVYPVTITIPPGTFIIPLPDPSGPITGVGPLTVQTCTGQLTAAIPDGSTQAQIQALAAGLAQQAAQAQAGCNALKSPGGSIPAPKPPVFSNNLQCVPTLTCTPPQVFTVTGSIPVGYQLAVDNSLCIVAGMITSTSQADADAKALAAVTAKAAALIGSGVLSCQGIGFNWNDETISESPFAPGAGTNVVENIISGSHATLDGSNTTNFSGNFVGLITSDNPNFTFTYEGPPTTGTIKINWTSPQAGPPPPGSYPVFWTWGVNYWDNADPTIDPPTNSFGGSALMTDPPGPFDLTGSWTNPINITGGPGGTVSVSMAITQQHITTLPPKSVFLEVILTPAF